MNTAILLHLRLRGVLQVLGAAGAIALLLGNAQAAPAPDASDDVPAVHVRYDDLNLASPDGTAELYRRIAAAAEEVCPKPERDVLGVLHTAVSRACRAQAIAGAVHQVHDQHLAALAERMKRG